MTLSAFEFGQKVALVMPLALTGAGLGAGVGAYRSPQGEKFRGALAGGALGGALGAGAGALAPKLQALAGKMQKGPAALTGPGQRRLTGPTSASPVPRLPSSPLQQLEAAVALPVPGTNDVAQTITRTRPQPMKTMQMGKRAAVTANANSREQEFKKEAFVQNLGVALQRYLPAAGTGAPGGGDAL